MTATQSWDVAIGGGGPAGCAAAIVLARAGLRVLLAPGTPSEFRIGEGLPPNARSLLQELGVLDRVLGSGHRPSYGTRSIWGADEPHANDFITGLHGAGLQLDRARFDAELCRAAQASGVDVRGDARLLFAERAPRDLELHALRLRQPSGEESVRCRWLIDASGRAAAFARRFGAVRTRACALLAFYARLSGTGEADHDASTVVEAVEDGWWYSVLLPSGERLVSFLCDADRVERRKLASTEGFWAKLGETRSLTSLVERHGYAPIGAPCAVDASSARLERAAGDRWLAVGDAALAFDPLSSKGIANALYTGLRGAEAVIAAERRDQDALVRYDAHLSQIFRVYSEQLTAFYAMERRFPDSEFWRRRSSVNI